MNETTAFSKLRKSSISAIVKNSSVKMDALIQRSHLPEPFRKKKIVFTVTAVLLVFIFFAFFNPSAGKSNVPVYSVKKGKFLVSVTESGELRAKNSISISTPRVRGNIKIVYLVPEGTRVNAGDTVIRFDPTEALNTLKDAESKLEIAVSEKDKLLANQKSGMTRMESDLKSAELSFELSRLKS
jgi:multidrug efflux pump subunit AcrA (membrane-fusion protein)